MKIDQIQVLPSDFNGQITVRFNVISTDPSEFTSNKLEKYGSVKFDVDFKQLTKYYEKSVYSFE